MSVYVGIDVHRKRSQVAVVTGTGEVQVNRNVSNGVEPILSVIGELPIRTPVAFEAAYGWGWLVEMLEAYGFEPHLAHPLQCKAIASARLKNDKVDAAILAQLLRADLLPEAWIAPPEVRALRALLRHRAQLVRARTMARNRIHAVLADHGQHRPAGIASNVARDWLAGLELPPVSRLIVEDYLALIDAFDVPIARLDAEVRERGSADPRVALRRGVTVLLKGPSEPHRRVLEAVGALDRLSHGNHVFTHLEDAVAHARLHVARALHGYGG